MEKRLLLAAALSLGVLLLWEKLVPRPPAPLRPTEVQQSASTATASVPRDSAGASNVVKPSDSASSHVALPPPVAASAEETTVLENDLVRVKISNRGAVVTSWVLLRHTDEEGHPLELVRQFPEPSQGPLAVDFPGKPDLTQKTQAALYVVEHLSSRAVALRYADDKVAVKKEFRLGEGYLSDIVVSVVGSPYVLFVGTGLRNPTEQELASRYVMPSTAVARTPTGFERAQAAKLQKPRDWPVDEHGFAGIEDNYFLAVLIPRSPATAQAIPIATKDHAGKPSATVAVGLETTGQFAARAYYGPKDVEVLESFGLGLEKTVDFGWYGILARPLLWLLKRAYSWFGNWGVAVLLVTFLIRVLLFPLMYRSYGSMKKMQKLSPKMNAIKDKYRKAKTDSAQRAKMNEELMKLYQAEGYNPMSGCLPMLIQLPILVAFYNVLRFSIELRHAPFFLWIRDLSAVDHTYVLLILMIVSMYVQQAMTPTTADPAQKKIFMAMPLIMGIFFKDMPSGLVLYWLFSNVLTVVQQVLINKMGSKDEPEPKKPARIKTARA